MAKCSCCFKYRTGCVIIGSLGILMNLYILTIHGFDVGVVAILSNALLAVVNMLLLPWMIINVAINSFLWIWAILLALGLVDFHDTRVSAFDFIGSSIIAAIFHVLIMSPVFGYFRRLREREIEQSRNQQKPLFVSSKTYATHPVDSIVPSPVYVPPATLASTEN